MNRFQSDFRVSVSPFINQALIEMIKDAGMKDLDGSSTLCCH